MLRNLFILLIFLTLSAFSAGCGGSSGGGGGGVDNSDLNPGVEGFSVADISIPTTVKADEQVTVSTTIKGKDSEIVLFQFLSQNGKSHMVPHSGIIATKNKTGQIDLAYKAPKTGTHSYYLKILNSDGEEIIKEFKINVVE